MTPDDARRLVLRWLTLAISLQREAPTTSSFAYGVTRERCARELAHQCGLTIRITKRTSKTHPPVIDVQFGAAAAEG
jgi:hypothetical protein